MAYRGRRFVRHYYDFPKEYPAVYNDDAAYATWGRLLMLADGSWPAPAVLPRSVKDEPLRLLVTAGLVTVRGDVFEVRGLNKLRQEEHDRQSRNVSHRYVDGATAEPTAEPTAVLPSKAKQSTAIQGENGGDTHTSKKNDELGNSGVEREREWIAVQNLRNDGLPNLTVEVVRLLEDTTGRSWSQAGQRQLGELDRLVGEYGVKAVWEAFGKVPTNGHKPTARQLVWSAMKLLEPLPDLKAAAVEEQKVEAQRRTSTAVERTLTANHFQHVEPHPRCPLCALPATGATA